MYICSKNINLTISISVMKRKLLLLLLFAIPFISFAGKRLTALTYNGKYSTERGVFTYDDQGRVCRVDIVKGQNNTRNFTYTYYGDSRIECNSSDDNTTVIYELDNGKVITMTIDMPSENLTVQDEFVYDGDKLVEMNLYVIRNGQKYPHERNTITWNGDNIAEYYHIQGEGTNKEAWKKYTFTASNLSSTPLVNTLFDCSFSTSPDYDDWIYMIGFFEHIGTTPKNLCETMIHDSDEKPQGQYTYQYGTNSDGDVVNITLTHDKDGSSVSYTLEWEEYTGIVAITSDSGRGDFYTIDGRHLQGAPTQRGIYIRDGRKYIVK